MNKVILIIFLLYSIFIVFIENIYIILSLLVIQFIILFLLKVKVKLKNIFLFITFIFLINNLLMDLESSLIISLRLISMYLIVIIALNMIGANNIAKILSSIFHSQELYLIISLSLTFIPIMKDEVNSIKKSLLVKNYEFNFINVIRKPKVFVVAFINSLFSKVRDLEKVIISSGFDE